MQLSKFQPSQPPQYVKQIMSDIVMLQRYNYLKIQKPVVLNNTPLIKPQVSYVKFEKNIEPLNNNKLKTKVIKKVKNQQINIKMQKKAQRILNVHLLYRLNESSIQAAQNRISPPFSILDTKQEDDYLPQGDKKQYPHFSNVLKPTQIPMYPTSTVPLPSYLPKITKIQKYPIFSAQQNCVYKIRHLYRFPKLLFKLGNEQFSKISQQMSISQCNIKLLYDLFNDYFEIEDKIDMRNQQQKKKYIKNIKKFIYSAFKKYKKPNQSMYIPLEEQFVNLKQIREIFNFKRQQSDSQDDD